MNLPRGRVGSVLAVALLLLAIAVLWTGVAAPLLAWHAEREERIDARQALLRRMRGLAASLPALERAAAAQGGAPALVLLDGAGDAVAAARLQAAVQDMAAAARVRLGSVETLAAVPRGAYRGIRLRLAAVAAWPALVELLGALDQAEPRMLVDELDLRAASSAERVREPPIEAGFVITAFRAADAPAVRP